MSMVVDKKYRVRLGKIFQKEIIVGLGELHQGRFFKTGLDHKEIV
jgi:hypothetical protein